VVTMAEQKIEWVNVVDADGNPIPGFEGGVPSHWIGSDLLPEGAKKASAKQAADLDKGDASE